MSTAQKIFVGIISTLLFVVLTVGIPVIAVSKAVASKEQVKQVLLSESVYSTIKDAFSQDPSGSLSPDGTQPAEPVSVDQEAVKKILDQFLTRAVYDENVNRLVDGFYSYLDGQTEVVNITIQLTNDPAGFQNFIVDSFASTYSSLPPCASGSIDPTTYDPLSADCQQPGIGPEQIRGLLAQNPDYQQLVNGSLTLSSAEIAPDSQNSQVGHLDPASLRNVRNTYQFLQSMKLVVIVSALLLLGILAAIVHSKQIFKVWAIAMLIPTSVLLIGGLLGWLLQRSLINSVSPAGGEAVKNTFLQEGTAAFVKNINQTVLVYTLVLLGLSLASLITWLIISRQSGTSAPVAPAKQVKA